MLSTLVKVIGNHLDEIISRDIDILGLFLSLYQLIVRTEYAYLMDPYHVL